VDPEPAEGTWDAVWAALEAAVAGTEAQIAAAIAGDAARLQALVPEQLARAAALRAFRPRDGTAAQRAAFARRVQHWARRLALLEALCQTQLAWLQALAGPAPSRGGAVDGWW